MPASIESGNLFACALHSNFPSCHMPVPHLVIVARTTQGVDLTLILPTKLVAMAMSLERSKNNFSSFIYGQSSTSPANFVKIRLVDIEISGLKEITKNII